MQDVCRASGTINIIYFKPCIVVAIEKLQPGQLKMGEKKYCRLLLCIAFLFIALVSIDARVGGGDARRQVEDIQPITNSTGRPTAKPIATPTASLTANSTASLTANSTAKSAVRLRARPIGRFRAKAIIKSNVKGARLRLGGGDLVPCSHERNKKVS